MKCFLTQPLSKNDEHFLTLQKEVSLDTSLSAPEDGFYLRYSPIEQELSLHKAGSPTLGLIVSFSPYKKKFEQQKLSAKKDLLARAIGLKPGLKIFDGTLGLAQDAFKLCYLGGHVIGVESNPWVYALLKNALFREQNFGELSQLQIHYGSAQSYIEKFKPYDVIYLDPMFEHKKKALPKKGMQFLSELVEDEEASFVSLLDNYKSYGSKLVVKRSLHAEPLCQKKPQHTIAGKMIRFDVYI